MKANAPVGKLEGMRVDTQIHPRKLQNFALAAEPRINRLRVDPEDLKTLDAREAVDFGSDSGRMGDGGGGDEDLVC